MRNILLYTILSLVLLSSLWSSCSSRRSKAEHRDIIPEKDLIGILTDSYIADGLLSQAGIFEAFSEGDTLTSYTDIIEWHGYTKEQMDRTMRFYFIRKPKKLVNIYDKVLGELSKLESVVDRDFPAARIRGLNFWPGEELYSFPSPDEDEGHELDLVLPQHEAYNINFTMTLYPGDQSIDPRPALYLSHTDSTGAEQRIYFPSFPYIRDGQPHNYNLFRMNEIPSPVRLRGSFINSSSTPPGRFRHYRVENILMTRSRVDQ